MTAKDETTVHIDPLFGRLEQVLIADYLMKRGYSADAIAALPSTERDALLKDASVYASSKLCEFESRSHFVRELHEAIGELPKKGRA
ncbi:MAG TPA: hypothetical protein VLV86_04445 [Vicinamibacterales bacterium]|nr:hypothetical protein [Vicinamibacterales bacterium]